MDSSLKMGTAPAQGCKSDLVKQNYFKFILLTVLVRVTNKYIMFFNNQKDFLNNLSKGLLLGDPE